MSWLTAHFQPADILGALGLVILAVLYMFTREEDLKAGLLGLVMFLAGRHSFIRHAA